MAEGTCADCPAPKVGRKKRCPDCQRGHDRRRLAEWRAANPEKVKAQERRSNRARYERDPESRRSAVKEWRQANRDRFNAYHREWRAANPERTREYHRKVRAARRDYYNEKVRRYQARRMEATVELVDYEAVGERYGWVCGICGEQMDPTIRGRTSLAVSFDHIIPLSKGGPHMAANLQPAHFGCNARKGNR